MLERLDQNTINIIMLAMSGITFCMALASMLPQIKTVLAIVRDVVLWGSLIVIVVVVGGVGWLRFAEALQRRAATQADRAVAVGVDPVGSPSIAPNRSSASYEPH
jgi:hypothetical protein